MNNGLNTTSYKIALQDRLINAWPNTRVIFFSGTIFYPPGRELREANLFIQPFSITDLLTLLHHILSILPEDTPAVYPTSSWTTSQFYSRESNYVTTTPVYFVPFLQF